MSEKTERRKRLNCRLNYAAAIENWVYCRPSIVRFLAFRRWLKEMPKKEDYPDGTAWTVDVLL